MRLSDSLTIVWFPSLLSVVNHTCYLQESSGSPGFSCSHCTACPALWPRGSYIMLVVNAWHSIAFLVCEPVGLPDVVKFTRLNHSSLRTSGLLPNCLRLSIPITRNAPRLATGSLTIGLPDRVHTRYTTRPFPAAPQLFLQPQIEAHKSYSHWPIIVFTIRLSLL